MTSLRLSFAALILCCYLVAWSEALDCRRFVFAPLCRGVSAKRSSQPSLPQLSNYQIDYDSSEDTVSTSDYKAAEKTNSNEEMKAANDQMMLYLLSQIPKLKSKPRMRPLLNDD